MPSGVIVALAIVVLVIAILMCFEAIPGGLVIGICLGALATIALVYAKGR